MFFVLDIIYKNILHVQTNLSVSFMSMSCSKYN